MRIASPCLGSLRHRVPLLYFECGEYRVIVMDGQANVSLNISDDTLSRRRCHLYQLIINGFVLGVIIIVGIIGNSLTFVVFWKGSFKLSASFLFLSLSLADSAVLLTCVPIDIARVFFHYMCWQPGYYYEHEYTRVYGFALALVAKMATIWVTVLIAVNRYTIVCLPLSASQWCTLTKVKRQLAVVIVLAVMCSIPQFLKCRITSDTWNDGTSNYTYTYSDCSTAQEWRASCMAYDGVVDFMLLSRVPLFILTLLTVRLIKAMKIHRRMQLEMNRVSNTQDSSVTSAFVIVVVVFIICHTPRFVVRLLSVVALRYNYQAFFWNEVNLHCLISELASMPVILNSAVNFAIYILACKSFRDVLIEHVCRRRTDMEVVIAHRAEGVNDEPDDDHDTPL